MNVLIFFFVDFFQWILLGFDAQFLYESRLKLEMRVSHRTDNWHNVGQKFYRYRMVTMFVKSVIYVQSPKRYAAVSRVLSRDITPATKLCILSELCHFFPSRMHAYEIRGLWTRTSSATGAKFRGVITAGRDVVAVLDVIVIMSVTS